MNRKVKNIFIVEVIMICMMVSGCFIAPLRVANPLQVTVEDSETGNPIPDARIVYIVSDLHDQLCKDVRVVRTTTDHNGRVEISGKRKWGIWITAPGGLPVPDHLIAIWAPSYSTYLFRQYTGIDGRKKACKNRNDILEALFEIPQESVSNDLMLNPVSVLIGGKVKLIKVK